MEFQKLLLILYFTEDDTLLQKIRKKNNCNIFKQIEKSYNQK